MLILFVLGGAAAIAGVPVWAWRLQRRVVAALMPGADLEDIAAIADLPLGAAIAPGRHLVTEPLVHLLALTREASSLLVAYRPVASTAATITTLLVDVASAGRRELAVLARWHTTPTAVKVLADLIGGEVAIQEPITRLTVTLPLLP